ncbi:hypothetical protein [Leptospira idonii]|uniref:Uncharacterized protein n=1 Tax=Leptospira idonii TaxID=1193500 RepID=A0A4R9LW21_9LEPT|nr:hypothetical protein [Leptospira idonii]TGN17263.1 hypothetical protein EHS15_17130 [Leptospira idonii]
MATKWLRPLLLSFSLPICFSFCKLNLNNAGDPFTENFLLTAAIKEYLRTCKTEQVWEQKIGTGNNYVVVTKNVVLPDGDIVIAGFASEPISPDTSSAGKNQSYSGTTGVTKEGFIVKLDGRDGKIQWLDYLGEVSGDNEEVVALGLFTNGDIAVSSVATGTEIPGGISPKTATNTLFVARYNSSGNRLWHTYLDSPNANGDRGILLVDDSDQIHLLIMTTTASPPHLGFSEFPSPKVASMGSYSDNDVCYALLSSAGVPIAQTFLSGTGSEYAYTIVQQGDKIYIGGRTTGNMNGFTGHPNSVGTYNRPYLAIADKSLNFSSIKYYGGSGTGTEGSINSLIKKDQELYSFALVDEPYGASAASPFQGVVPRKNLLYQKLALDGTEIWHSFLGTSTSGILDKVRPGFLLSHTNSVYSNILGPPDGTRYTGVGDKESGDGSGRFQMAVSKMNASNGELQALVYKSNLPQPGLSLLFNTKEMCQGKVNYLQFVQPRDTFSNQTYVMVRTAPTTVFP